MLNDLSKCENPSLWQGKVTLTNADSIKTYYIHSAPYNDHVFSFETKRNSIDKFICNRLYFN